MAVNCLTRIGLFAAPFLFRAVSGLLFATCRVTEEGRERYDALRSADKPFIIAFWHYSLLLVVHRGRREGKQSVAMVSSSDDAEFVSRILQGYGIKTVRGSRNRRGVAALKEMIKLMRGGRKCGVIVADGSQGPPLQLQPGLVLLASKTGAPVLPVAWAADRYWAFGSWDRTVLPKPFSRIYLRYGEPVPVPAGIKSDELEEVRAQIEKQALALYDEVWGRFGVSSH